MELFKQIIETKHEQYHQLYILNHLKENCKSQSN